jgi:hypothetical protein
VPGLAARCGRASGVSSVSITLKGDVFLKSALLCLSTLLFAVFTPSVFGLPTCGNNHFYFKDSPVPMFEAGTPSPVMLYANSGFVTVLSSCDDELSTSNNQAFSAIWRAFLSFEEGTAPVGSTVEVEFRTKKNGVSTLHRVISRRVQRTINKNHPQTETVSSFLAGLSGANGYELRARLVGNSGYLKLFAFTSAQGSLVSHGSNQTLNVGSVTLTTTWQDIGSVVVNNTSGNNIDIQVQGHFEIAAGSVAGRRISVGFGREYGNAGNHYPHIYVPQSLPENVTILDYMPNEGVGDPLLPPGQSTIRMWAKVDAGTVTVSNRRVEVLAMGDSVNSIRFYPFHAGPQQHDENSTSPQPQAASLLDRGANDCGRSGFQVCNDTDTLPQTYEPHCGRWTPLLVGTIPPNSFATSMVGSGYVEITGKTCAPGYPNCWEGAPTRVHVAIETVTPGSPAAGVDVISVITSVINDRTYLFLPSDVFGWGNSGGNEIRLWIRFDECNSPDVKGRQLQIGKAYVGLRWFHNPGFFYHP